MFRFLRTFALRATVVSLLASGALASAQSKPAKAEPEPATSFGTVTGHVYFAGSNAPARFVQIGLQPVEIKAQEEQPSPGKMLPMTFTIYRTGLDGGFTIPRVQPGSYYIVTKEGGYLSPFSQFTPAELEHPTGDVAQRMAAALPTVVVRPTNTATINITLQRGASVSGTVRFDDGTPYPQAGVSISRRGSNGKWASPRAMDSYTNADGDGHWQIAGLPAGEYRVTVNINVEERHQSALLGENTSMWVSGGYSLNFYLGDTVRERDARLVTLTDGQALDGQDLTIPVSKLHALSGAVVDQRTGQAVNAGHVSLVYADDGKEVTSTAIDPDTRMYTFPFIMEGEYKLQVKDAREVRFEQGGDPTDDPFHQNRKEIPLRQYAPGELPLIVQGEMSGANVPVEANPAKTP